MKHCMGTLALVLTLAACGGATPSGTATGGDVEDRDPETGIGGASVDSMYHGPISCDDPALGEANYNAMCNGCHSGYAPQMADIGWSAAAMRRQIREGEASMPAFSEEQLSNELMDCILDHLTTIGAVQAAPAPAETVHEEESSEAPTS